MVRSHGLPRLVAGLSVVPFAALLAVACGGSDVVDSADGSAPDAHLPDAKLADALPNQDGTGPEEDSEAPDAEGPDGGIDADASRDADAALLDADASHDADAALVDADAAFDSGFDSGTVGLFQTLGSARPFVILSGATVTNSGINTVLLGDVGTTGPSVTGLTGPPFQPSGRTEVKTAVAGAALADVTTAYTALQGAACPPANALTGLDLGGRTLAPGVYCFTSSALMGGTTTLTFDAQGDPNAVWVIQVATSLTIGDNVNVTVINGPVSLACRIFWVAGASATIGVNSHFAGNVLALAAVSLNTNATLFPGRAFGQNAGVTLLSNTASASTCQ